MSGWIAGISLAITAASAAYTMSQGTPSMPTIPKAQVPAARAASAPGARTDTGASVSIGTAAEDIKNQRVSSGSRRSTGASSTGDVLGGLGRSGLSI